MGFLEPHGRYRGRHCETDLIRAAGFHSLDDLPADLTGKRVLVRVVSWYDNEWGFSNRMIDTAAAMAKLG